MEQKIQVFLSKGDWRTYQIRLWGESFRDTVSTPNRRAQKLRSQPWVSFTQGGGWLEETKISGALWIREGYRNTKFFHCYVSHRRNRRSISTMGECKSNFDQIIAQVVRHFSDLFKEPLGYPIKEILQVLNAIPNSIFVETNECLTTKVTEDKNFDTLSSRKRSRPRWSHGIIFSWVLWFGKRWPSQSCSGIPEERKYVRIPQFYSSVSHYKKETSLLWWFPPYRLL